MGVVDLELLIVVKAYPNPSESQGEACCVVGIDKQLGFVRIYPVPFRDLEDAKKFRKYEVIRLKARKPKSDPRPNTFRPHLDTIEVVSDPLPTANKWQARKDWAMPLAAPSMCEIIEQQKAARTSMGFFKPREVLDVVQQEEPEKEWSAGDVAKLGQSDMFLTQEKKLLEKLPYRWRYRYTCSAPGCNGHTQTIIDWELGQLYRSLKFKGVTDPDAIHESVRQKYLHQMCGPDKDTYFFTGNMAAHQGSFLILGVFWPPVDPQGRLF